jgi:hypothetical protein
MEVEAVLREVRATRAPARIPFRLLMATAILTLAAGTAAAETAFSVIAESSKGSSPVLGISANGSVVVGVSDGRVFRWTPDRGLAYKTLDAPRAKGRSEGRRPSAPVCRPYEQKRLQLLRASRRRNRTKDLSSFFCSEFVAEAYQRMGLLPPKPPSNNYTPRDFSSEREDSLPLLLGATLGQEVVVCHKAET